MIDYYHYISRFNNFKYPGSDIYRKIISVAQRVRIEHKPKQRYKYLDEYCEVCKRFIYTRTAIKHRCSEVHKKNLRNLRINKRLPPNLDKEIESTLLTFD